MGITQLIISCFYFMLPAYFANMAPIFIKNIFGQLAFPLDFNKKLSGKPIFGKNKTFRGLFFAVLFGMAIAFLQHYFYSTFKAISFFDYSNWLLFGFLMGFGAIFGDLVKSFIKRRLDIKPGQRFFPWDQLDFIIGALVLSTFVYIPSMQQIIVIILISVLAHIIVNHSAYYLKIRNEKW